MRYSLSLFYKYADEDLDRRRKAVGRLIRNRNGKWWTITDLDREYIQLGEGKSTSWSTLLKYFAEIDLDELVILEIYEHFENENSISSLGSDCKAYVTKSYQWAKCKIELRRLLEEYQFEDAESFYQNHCTEFITQGEYKRECNPYLARFRELQKSKFMGELRYLLEQYKFEDAKKFYEDQYAKSIIISPEEYLREHNMYYARFRESQKSNLMIELRRFLEQYKLEDADNFYHNQCAKFITSDEYKRERIQYLKRFRESQKSNLMDELRRFLDQYQFENAKSFYHSQCAEFITLLEYQTEHNQYFHRFCNLYRSRLEIVIRENFLDTDKIYQEQYKSYISIEEYNNIKQKFAQNWIRNNLGNMPDLEQSLAISSVNSHVQLIARAGSGKTSTLVNRAIFLQRHCGIKSSEILLLAFNRKAAQEIRERLQRHLHNDLPYTMTFHALAYAIVRPDETLVYNETGGQQAQTHLIQSVIGTGSA